MTALVAIIGFFGSGAVGVWIADWLRKRDRRAAALADLDIWSKMPDSEVKSALLSSIEQRVEELMVDRESTLRRWVRYPTVPWVPGLVGALIFLGCYWGFLFTAGNARAERHPDGLLWIRQVESGHVYLQSFSQFVMPYLVICTVYVGVCYVQTFTSPYVARMLPRSWTRDYSPKGTSPEAD